MADPFARLRSFLAELKRRRVYRVGAVYIGVTFVLLEGLDLVQEALSLPSVLLTALTVVALFGFPLALVLAWAFEATPEGVRRTESLEPGSRVAGPGRGGVWLVLALGVLGAAAGWWWHMGRDRGPAVDVSEIRSVAVLPLDNLSGDPEEAPFVAGMHDELINQLSRVGALLVKSRTSVMQYGGDSATTIPEIGRALGVDAVIEGSVLRADDQVRITVQLIHVPTDTHLWSRSFDRELRDVLALHSDVARAVANEVEAALTPGERERLRRTREVDPEALDHYVRGRYLWNQREHEALADALDEFRAALDIDPTYAEAWAAIADVYVVPSGGNLAEDPIARAIEAARRALAIDSTLAQAHAALGLGLVAEWEWEASEGHFQRAIELNPSYATAHQWYAELLIALNRPDEAVASARHATVLDPLSGIIAWNLARILYFADRSDEALEQLKRVPDGERDAMLGTMILLQLGRPDSAWAEFLTAAPIPPPVRPFFERLRDQGLDPIAAAQRAIQQAPAVPGQGPPPGMVAMGEVEVPAMAGRRDEALDRLEDLADDPDRLTTFIVDLVADPLLDPIRGTPRYRAFLRNVGLARYWPADDDD